MHDVVGCSSTHHTIFALQSNKMMKARAARRLPSWTATESVRPRGFDRERNVDPRLLKPAPGWFELSLYYGLPTCTIYPKEKTISQHFNLDT